MEIIICVLRNLKITLLVSKKAMEQKTAAAKQLTREHRPNRDYYQDPVWFLWPYLGD
jgi:hypothetical protein